VYGQIALTPRSLEEYLPIVGRQRLDELQRLARPLKGLRVLNLSVTAFGTGTAELLSSSVPLLCDLGLDCHWQVVRSDEKTTTVNRAMYRALAGGDSHWNDEMTKVWQDYTEMNAGLFDDDFDVVVVHDPQPTAIRSYLRCKQQRRSHWLFHSHIDLSAANSEVWRLLEDHLQQYEAWIFEEWRFLGDVKTSLPVTIVPPAIDPLALRNMEISGEAMRDILGRYGIDCERPLIAQVAPLTPESDALGAIDVYERLRQQRPDLQLALLATSLPEDPKSYPYFEEVAGRVANLPGAHILSNLDNVGDIEINLVQRASVAVMQRSLQRGFGIWLSDALWKETPVVAAPMGGVSRQVLHGCTGFLADTTEEFARHMMYLLENPDFVEKLGKSGRQHVLDHFTLCRYLSDYLGVLVARTALPRY